MRRARSPMSIRFMRSNDRVLEGGIVSEGSAHVRFSMRSYRVAIFFVVFDNAGRGAGLRLASRCVGLVA
jgi:hypothetical protein